MASRVRRVAAALVIAVLASTVLFGVGCGGGEHGSERAVEWGVERQLGPRQVLLAATVRSCTAPPELLERPLIDYSDNQVFIELRTVPEDLEGQKGCLLQLFTAFKKVTFNRDLDELVLFDSSTDPPEQRWPRDGPDPG